MLAKHFFFEWIEGRHKKVGGRGPGPLVHGFLHFRLWRPSPNTVKMHANCDVASIDLGCVGDVSLSLSLSLYIYIYIYRLKPINIFSKVGAYASSEVSAEALF